MKRNVLQNVTSFVFKYIWVFCAVLITLESFFTVFSATVLMKQTAQGMVQSVSGEIFGRIDGVVRLLHGIAKDPNMGNIQLPLYDRTVYARPYAQSYDLFLIGITDEEVNVVGTTDTEPPTEDFSLAGRDYMQRLYATGKDQITGAFPAGADGTTMNYTVAVPILKNGVVKGSVFGSIYFDDIEEIIDRNNYDGGRCFYLVGADNTFMAGGATELYGKSFLEAESDTRFFGTSVAEIDSALLENRPVSYWSQCSDGLCYTTALNVAQTGWKLLYQVGFTDIIRSLLPVFLVKVCFYMALCAVIYVFGRRYLKRQLAAASHMMDRIMTMEKEVLQGEQTDYEKFLDLTQKGLTDQLTGLCTRSVLFSRMQQVLDVEKSFGAVFFLDLDNLKRINDGYGHDVGDRALVQFAAVLKKYEEQYQGIASRYGGDEFILILSGLDDGEIRAVAENICSGLNVSLVVAEKEIPICGSIGIALYPRNGGRAEDLICKADVALYNAKHSGKSTYSFYEEVR